MNRLNALFSANRGRGLPFQARVQGDEMTLEVYDVIYSSQSDADWLGGGIGADAFTRALRDFSGSSVNVRINSPGGDAAGGVAMAAAIRESKARVTAFIDGHALSAASIVAAAADRVVISAGGMMMIHKAWTMAVGNSEDMLAMASVLEKVDGQIVEAYREKAGDSRDWEALMKAETWFTASEAVAAGLADEIAQRAEKPKALAFDLSAYANAPAPENNEQPQADPEIERRKAKARLAALPL